MAQLCAELRWAATVAPSPRMLGAACAEHTAPIAKTRYRQADAACTVARVRDSGVAVEFDSPQWAVTPGQPVMLYDREVCLGGAVIA